nr:hypothetical protein [Tanacetum cinerariifolium]
MRHLQSVGPASAGNASFAMARYQGALRSGASGNTRCAGLRLSITVCRSGRAVQDRFVSVAQSVHTPVFIHLWSYRLTSAWPVAAVLRPWLDAGNAPGGHAHHAQGMPICLDDGRRADLLHVAAACLAVFIGAPGVGSCGVWRGAWQHRRGHECSGSDGRARSWQADDVGLSWPVQPRRHQQCAVDDPAAVARRIAPGGGLCGGGVDCRLAALA